MNMKTDMKTNNKIELDTITPILQDVIDHKLKIGIDITSDKFTEMVSRYVKLQENEFLLEQDRLIYGGYISDKEGNWLDIRNYRLSITDHKKYVNLITCTGPGNIAIPDTYTEIKLKPNHNK